VVLTPAKKPKSGAGDVGLTTAAAVVDLLPEYNRLKLVAQQAKWWRSDVNEKYEICKSYPSFLIVPASITNEDIKEVAKFRNKGRIPAVVWMHPIHQTVIARCAQPKSGVQGLTSTHDQV